MVPTLLKSFSRFSIRKPRLALCLCFLAVLCLAPGITRLTLATDGLALVPEDSQAAEMDREAREFFGIHDQVIVVLRSSDPRGVLNLASLARLAELTSRITAMPAVGADRVQSLANERSDRVRPGTLEFVSWLTPLPTNEEDLVRLTRDIHDARVYDGTMLSTDSPPSMTACLVDVPRDLERASFVRDLRTLLAELDSGADEFHLVGAPIAESTLGHHILEDLARLVPLTLLCMLAIFLAVFRRPVAALLPLMEVGACLVCVLGLMGLVGAPIYLTVAILPVVLTAVGIADELHLFMHFLEVEGGRVERVRKTMDDMTRPIVQTSVTTAIGFLSFTFSPLVPVRVFGLFMAIGVVFCMLWSLVAVPAMLVLLPDRYWGPPRTALRVGWIARVIASHRKRAALVAVLLVFPCFLGIARLEVQDSWVSGFASDSEFARSTRLVDKSFGGAHLLRVRIDAGGAAVQGVLQREQIEGDSVRLRGELASTAEALAGQRLAVVQQLSGGQSRTHSQVISQAEFVDGDTILTLEPQARAISRSLSARPQEYSFTIDASDRMLRHAVLAKLEATEAFLAAQEELGIGRVLGPHEHLAAMNFMLRLRDPNQYRVPEDPREISAVLDRYVDVRGKNRLREILGPDSSSALITVFLRHSNYKDTELLMKRVRDFAARELEPVGLRLSFAGDVAVSQSMIHGIVKTQITSLAFSLLSILIVTSLFLRSFTLGFACTLPALLAVGAVLGCMGLAGIPLGVATSMFAATVLGIGVDYAIHLVHRARASTTASGVDWRKALLGAAPPLLLDTLAIGVAFAILASSQVPANALLGVCVGLSLLICAIVTLALLPTCTDPALARVRNSGTP